MYDRKHALMIVFLSVCIFELPADDWYTVYFCVPNCIECMHVYTHEILQVAVSIINKFMEADGKHDALSNKEVAEKMNEAGFASQVKMHACKDVSRHMNTLHRRIL